MSKPSIGQIKTLYRTAVNGQRKLDRESETIELCGESVKEKRRNDWYKTQEELKEVLLEILRTNFVLLSKPELVRFLSMCSSHRPMEPHGVLTLISMQYKELYP